MAYGSGSLRSVTPLLRHVCQSWRPRNCAPSTSRHQCRQHHNSCSFQRWHHIDSSYAVINPYSPHPQTMKTEGLLSPVRMYMQESSPLQTVLGCTSSQDVLERLGPLLSSASELSSGNIVDAVKHLMEMKYEELQTIPWLQQNINLAFVQLILSGRLSTEMEHIWLTSSGEQLLNCVCDQHKIFSNSQITELLLFLLYLGVPNTSKPVYLLLVECLARVPEMSMNHLVVMSYVSQCIHKSSAGMAQLIPRAKQLMLDPSYEWTPEVQDHFMQTLINCRRVVSSDFWHKGTNRVAEYISKEGYLATPQFVGTHLRFARKLVFSQMMEMNQSRYIIEKSCRAIEDLIPELQSGHIAEICNTLKVCRCFSEDLASKFQARSVEILLTENYKLADVSNLLYALTGKTHISMKRQFETALYQKLAGNDMDSVLLSNIADNLLSVNIRNRDVLNRFQELVVKHTEEIFFYASRFSKIVRLLARRRFINHSLEREFNQKLYALLEDSKSVTLSEAYMSSLASYLLPRSHPAINDSFMRILLPSIPQWRVPSLYRLSFGLNSMTGPHTSQLQLQMSQLQTCLHQTIQRKVEDIENLDYLYQLTLGLVVHSQNRDPSLTTKIMGSYPSFTQNLTDVSMMKVTQMFHAMNYYLESVYDDLADFVVKNAARLEEDKAFLLLDACAKVGYLPRQQEEFVNTLLGFADKFQSKGDLNNMLIVLKNLALLQSFPEEVLARLFTLDFMETLDAYMEEQPHLRKFVERNMMELNRCVVLECPQLDIPWFHEQYCAENIAVEENREIGSLQMRFRDDVEMALGEVLGDTTLLQRWTLTPYYYVLNFECALDIDQNPVDLEDSVKDDVQRVAIITLTERAYCFNSKRLIGLMEAKKRHLEIMGYKVVEVPYFHWYSMGLTDWQAKVDYLTNKILS